MCIDIVVIWLGTANGQILSIFDRVICPQHIHIFISCDNFSVYPWIFTKFGMCIDIVEICFWIVNGQVLLIFDSVICLQNLCILISAITGENLNGFPQKLICALIL